MTPVSSRNPCPVCGSEAIITVKVANNLHWDQVTCPRCDTYSIADKDGFKKALDLAVYAIKIYAEKDQKSSDNFEALCIAVAKCAYSSKTKASTVECRAILSHVLSRAPVNRILTDKDFADILTHNSLPSPSEQAENLIKFLGDKLAGMGDHYSVLKDSDEIKKMGALIGAKIGSEWNDYYALVVALESQGLISIDWDPGNTSGGKKIISSISLTLLGWNKFEELQRSTSSRIAFVAMKFKSADDEDYYFQDNLLPNYLVSAAKKTGFTLSNPLADNPKAGNLHARLEVEIRNARFVLVELSHRNNGAYWEAGFAKGLGKPVIYMYNKEIGGQDKPHFDVGSDQIIFWDKANPSCAAQSLKDIIRNTLFGEAIQNDDFGMER